MTTHGTVPRRSRTLAFRAGALLTLASVVAMTAGASPAHAGTATANLSVTATVNANCTITTATLAFGTYDPVVTHAATALDSTGSVTITCTRGAVTSIELSLGSNASGSTRRMTNGTSFLAYEIYQEAGRTTVWRTGADKLDTGTAPDISPRTYTAYGRVAAGQDVSVGSYTDTVTATVNF